MNSLVNELVFLCKYCGSRSDLVQAGGGNISIKENDRLFIKASGCILSEVEIKNGFSVVDLTKAKSLHETLKVSDSGNFGRELEKIVIEGKRPSIETPLHALLDWKYVVHIHPVVALALTSNKQGKSLAKELFPQSIWVPYQTPGLNLAIEFGKNIKQDCSIYFLENHGIVLGSDHFQQIISLLESCIKKLELHYKIESLDESSIIMNTIYHQTGEMKTVYRSQNMDLKIHLRQHNYELEIICPDDVVYLGCSILSMVDSIEKEFDFFIKKYKVFPKVIAKNDELYFIASNLVICRQMEEQLYANILARSYNKEVMTLNKNEIEFLLNWEAEKYRQSLKVK